MRYLALGAELRNAMAGLDPRRLLPPKKRHRILGLARSRASRKAIGDGIAIRAYTVKSVWSEVKQKFLPHFPVATYILE